MGMTVVVFVFFGLVKGFGFVGVWVVVGSGVAMGGWFCSPWVVVGLWDLGILAPRFSVMN